MFMFLSIYIFSSVHVTCKRCGGASGGKIVRGTVNSAACAVAAYVMNRYSNFQAVLEGLAFRKTRSLVYSSLSFRNSQKMSSSLSLLARPIVSFHHVYGLANKVKYCIKHWSSISSSNTSVAK